jgi:hypothetical protein
MHTEALFGLWDTNAGHWSVEPALDYTAHRGLDGVKSAAQAGNYPAAERALLGHFRNREARTPPRTSYGPELAATPASVLLDHIWTLGSGEIYQTTFAVHDVDAPVTLDVTGAVASAAGEGWIGFMLMARQKAPRTARFHSRKDPARGPRLELAFADGTSRSLRPAQNTYIAAGSAQHRVFGQDEALEVRDQGHGPFHAMTRKAYLAFDLAALPDQPEKAILQLTGAATGTDPMQIMLYRVLESFDETTRTWSSTVQNTFSWAGDPAGFDWHRPCGADTEYGWQLPRFRIAGRLADEYRDSGDEAIARGLIDLMTGFIETADGYGGDGAPGFPRNLDAACRLREWVYAYEVLRLSPSLSPEANSAILEAIWRGAAFLHTTTHPTPNWMFTIKTALLQVAKCFPEFAASGRWRKDSAAFLTRHLDRSLHPDGGYREASSHYAWNVAIEAPTAPTLRRLAWFLADQTYPNGFEPAYGNAWSADRRGDLARLADQLDDAQLRYVTTQGAQGDAPHHTSTVYPNTRVAIQRTGWQADDLYLRFNTDRGEHAQSDDLSVLVYGYGRVLLPSMGTFSYSDDARAKWLRSHSQAANTITVDGVPQAFDAPAGLTHTFNGDGLDLAIGYTDASPAVRHTRSVLFVRGHFWIVTDLLEPHDDTEHRYEQTWHALPDAGLTLDPETLTARTNFPAGGNIRIIPTDPSMITGSLKDGFYSPRFYQIRNARYLSYSRTASGRVQLHTLLYPTSGEGDPRIVITQMPAVSASGQAGSVLRIDVDGCAVGWYFCSDTAGIGTPLQLGPYTFDGSLTYIGLDEHGGVQHRLHHS